MKTYTVMVKMIVTEAELLAARGVYKNAHNSDGTDIQAIASDIQNYCYDDGCMHGEFVVLSVEEVT
jgi:hypothetical protein